MEKQSQYFHRNVNNGRLYFYWFREVILDSDEIDRLKLTKVARNSVKHSAMEWIFRSMHVYETAVEMGAAIS